MEVRELLWADSGGGGQNPYILLNSYILLLQTPKIQIIISENPFIAMTIAHNHITSASSAQMS